MSKAEERSKEIMQAALDYANNLDDIKPTGEFRRNLCILLGQAFIKGAEWADEHQAEKDLELTWKDIADILDATDVIANDDSMEERLKTMSEEEYCQEVLKCFKKMKED